MKATYLVFIGVMCLVGALCGVSAADSSVAVAAAPVAQAASHEASDLVALEAGAEAEAEAEADASAELEAAAEAETGVDASAHANMERRRRWRWRRRRTHVATRVVNLPPLPNPVNNAALAAQSAANNRRLAQQQQAAHAAALARQQAGARMHASRAIAAAVQARSRHCNQHCTNVAIQRFAARMKALTGPLPNSFAETGAMRRRRWRRRRHRVVHRVVHRRAPSNYGAVNAAAAAQRAAADRAAAAQRANADRVAAQNRANVARQAAESLRRSLAKINARPCVCTNHINAARNRYRIAKVKRDTQIARHQRTLQAKRMAEARRIAKENAEKARKAAELAARQRAEAARKAKEMADRMAKQVKNLPKAARKAMQKQVQTQMKKTASKAAKKNTPRPKRASKGGQETHARLDSAMGRVARATASLNKLKHKISSMRKALKSNAIKNVIKKEAEGAVRNYLTSSGVAQPKNKDRIKQWIPADLVSQHKLYKYYATAEKPVYLGVLNKAHQAGKDAYQLHSETLTFLEDDQIAHKQAQQLKEAAVRRMG